MLLTYSDPFLRWYKLQSKIKIKLKVKFNVLKNMFQPEDYVMNKAEYLHIIVCVWI